MMKIDPIVTKHGEERIRGRLGLPARAVERMARNALARGKKRTEFTGPLRSYLDKLYRRGMMENRATDIIVYNHVIYLFCNRHLLTCWKVPSKLKKGLK